MGVGGWRGGGCTRTAGGLLGGGGTLEGRGEDAGTGGSWDERLRGVERGLVPAIAG